MGIHDIACPSQHNVDKPPKSNNASTRDFTAVKGVISEAISQVLTRLTQDSTQAGTAACRKQ